MKPAWVTGTLRSHHHVQCHVALSGRTQSVGSCGTVQQADRQRHCTRKDQHAKLHAGKRRRTCATASDAQIITGDADLSSRGAGSSGSSGSEDALPAAAQLADNAPQQQPAAEPSDVSPLEAHRRLKRAADLLRMVHMMVPGDPDSFNPALVIWQAIRDVPPHHRAKLLDMITPSDIERLWKLAEQRYVADGPAALAAIGPSYSQWQDFPDDIGQVAVFEGRAAGLPAAGIAGLLRLDRFQKCFFLHPDTEELLGRVDVQAGPAGDLLYPLYFAATLGSSVVPATGEVADMQLEYAGPAQLSLSAGDLPSGGWPRPRAPRWPFGGELSDYLRTVGPGVYVGVGWKAPRAGKDAGRRFLTFMMVRRPEV